MFFIPNKKANDLASSTKSLAVLSTCLLFFNTRETAFNARRIVHKIRHRLRAESQAARVHEDKAREVTLPVH